ncbi:Vacuolar protein sorting-associated protein 41 [Fulvia fulva]|uniref:Vacuolar protein sorting-associated protein 41 n=1 Tax=Passalora fulva TaxID=5499 RepID=A0A9Q8UV76_PASFU|nr:Vacuolar protein sorting-associated protein 41 [Fulvia fulva]KAK4612570.1 Vacuolar protein sorting-associated protein 41 [Fulvia fulva]UJO23681.1 Vacuolar protein sorting-associated protein 41 [Fulvia fulva]
MSAARFMTATESDTSTHNTNHDRMPDSAAAASANDGDEEEEEEEEDDDDDDDDEPKLKYARLTGSLANAYRNADSTSAFAVVGDKMVVGTHNGSIHALAVPALESLRTYRAHQATVTSISISPVPPAPVLVRRETGSAAMLSSPPPSSKGIPAPTRTRTGVSNSRTPPRQQEPVPNTPNNQIYIATSSLDGHVCVSSLMDPAHVQLRNFARPVNAVALSPDYENDKTYLSGGLAGSLILTVGGKAGVSTDANTNSAAAAASGWLGSIGLGSNTGSDKSLHSGEGAINSIKWSHSGKWVVWVNEEGIKIMRSHLKLGSEDQEDAWRRIAHAARPNRKGWEDMAGVWKGRCEWIDEKTLESDDLTTGGGHDNALDAQVTNGNDPVRSRTSTKGKKVEKLLVGWGDTAWVLHVQTGSSTAQGPNAKRQIGSADIIHKLQFRDCIISGISFYTPSLLAILAYRTRDDDDHLINAPHSVGKGAKDDTPRKARQHRHTSLAPQLRLVNVVNGEEVELDELSRISRYETLSAQDYHLGALYMPPPLPDKAAKEQTRGKLEDIWDVTKNATVQTLTVGGYATRMFSSGASIMSGSSDGRGTNGRTGSFRRQGSVQDVTPTPEVTRRPVDAHPYTLEPGLKLFIHSPYDCVLAVKRELSDHLEWLLEHQQYGEAWQLIDEHPEAVDTSASDLQSSTSQPSSPIKSGVGQNGSLADFFADENSSQSTGVNALRAHNSTAQKEKRRIGDLWMQQLVSDNEWEEAGKIAGKVLGTSSRWEHWVWTFAQADKFDEITPYIPSTALKPPLPTLVYEVILGHYIGKDRERLSKLLDVWDPDLFDVKSVISAIEDRLESGEVTEDGTEHGIQGRDWRILMEALARLYFADGRARDALRCYIALQDAEKAFSLIREEKLMDVVVDDVPGLVMLRISREQMRSAPLSELEEASSEAIQLLIDEAHRGTVPVISVVQQLTRKGDNFQPFLFFYFRTLWKTGPSTKAPAPFRRGGPFDTRKEESHAMVEDHADLAVKLFAEYDRDLLYNFVKASQMYSYDKAAEICERRHYIPELVHILSKTGQTKRALYLIIGELGDVSQAISFAKENPDLWNDLLDYSMDKPSFIKGLLEEVGAAAAFNPIDVVRRIPEGLEVEGLKQGIQRLVREFEIQMSISEGVAKVLRGEVGMGMDTLRAGRKKGVRFEVVHESPTDVDLAVHDPPTKVPKDGESLPVPKRKAEKPVAKQVKPGHCVGCSEPFREDDKETLIGFACGHVYHLSCLLDANPDTNKKEADNVLDQLATAAEEDDGGYGGRSVGGKVAHAHIINSVVKGGCQHCIIPEGA